MEFLTKFIDAVAPLIWLMVFIGIFCSLKRCFTWSWLQRYSEYEYAIVTTYVCYLLYILGQEMYIVIFSQGFFAEESLKDLHRMVIVIVTGFAVFKSYKIYILWNEARKGSYVERQDILSSEVFPPVKIPRDRPWEAMWAAFFFLALTITFYFVAGGAIGETIEAAQNPTAKVTQSFNWKRSPNFLLCDQTQTVQFHNAEAKFGGALKDVGDQVTTETKHLRLTLNTTNFPKVRGTCVVVPASGLEVDASRGLSFTDPTTIDIKISLRSSPQEKEKGDHTQSRYFGALFLYAQAHQQSEQYKGINDYFMPLAVVPIPDEYSWTQTTLVKTRSCYHNESKEISQSNFIQQYTKFFTTTRICPAFYTGTTDAVPLQDVPGVSDDMPTTQFANQGDKDFPSVRTAEPSSELKLISLRIRYQHNILEFTQENFFDELKKQFGEIGGWLALATTIFGYFFVERRRDPRLVGKSCQEDAEAAKARAKRELEDDQKQCNVLESRFRSRATGEYDKNSLYEALMG